MPAPDKQRIPDDTSLSEHGSVSTAIEPGTERRLRRATAALAAILVIGFLGVRTDRFFDARALARAAGSAYTDAPPVDVVIAQPAAAGQELVLPGQTAAWFESVIYARVNGYVAKWSADIGDHVKKGQVLAIIDTPDLDAELGAARAQLGASQAQVVARRAEAEFGRSSNERWRDAPKGVVSEQERDAKRADYEAAAARLYAATAQVALDQAKVDQFAALARYKQVTAPFDGTISERKIDVGNLVTAGSTATTTSLYRIVQNDPLRVFVDVPQSVAAELTAAGVPAQVRAPGAPGGAITGKIARSAGAIDAQARTMRVEVDVANPTHALVPGLYVTVAFALIPKGGVQVPAAALVFRAGGAQVARVGADGKVHFQAVTIARDDGSMVELAGGVSKGDRLVLNIGSQITEGQVVKINPPATT